MYKVFVNKTPIILTENIPDSVTQNWEISAFKDKAQLRSVVMALENKVVKRPVCITHYDIDELWFNFMDEFKYVTAAGGLVFNQKNEFLMIHRNGRWDLPKGHLKKGERPEYGAMREVEEECGIDSLKIISPLANTFHMYERKGMVLKKTFWFVMKSSFTGNLTPQLEEGIDKVKWKTSSDVEEMMKKSYPIIAELLEKGVG